MVNIPVLRWGRPYTSLEVDNVIHFITGETLAQVSQANAGLLAKDIRQAQRARDLLCEIPCRELIKIMKKAGELYKDATLPLGDGEQSPADFARQQSASTGLPEHMFGQPDRGIGAEHPALAAHIAGRANCRS